MTGRARSRAIPQWVVAAAVLVIDAVATLLVLASRAH